MPTEFSQTKKVYVVIVAYKTLENSNSSMKTEKYVISWPGLERDSTNEKGQGGIKQDQMFPRIGALS